MEEQVREGRSLKETPTWAFATVITLLVSLGFFFLVSLKQFGKWLDKTRRKSLLAALQKIKEELMLFGVLSLLMGHWSVVVAKICVKTSAFSSRFFPCAWEGEYASSVNDFVVSTSESVNKSVTRKHFGVHQYCPEGHESFASYESLEQLQRFIFVLGITHVLYSFAAIALAMLKIYSWRVWENEAKTIANQSLEDSPEALPNSNRMRRMSTFVDHHTSHPWSQDKYLVWMLCFSRQFWSSINRSDYMALRLGFITTHQLPLSYVFHNYMLRSMEEEFRDIVGISIPLWIYAICCMFIDFHGSNIYFWLSFLPAILILIIGTKLHRVVVKLAVEIMDHCPYMENRRFNLRDELFWFGRPRLLLHLIQLIYFQNAFEMATFLWSLWEIKGPSCFMENRRFLVIRLSFGLISQFWCSFITFPLYVIITQGPPNQYYCAFGSSIQTVICCFNWVFNDGIKVQENCDSRKCEKITLRVEEKSEGQTCHVTYNSTFEFNTNNYNILGFCAKWDHRSDDFASTSTEGSSCGLHNTSTIFPQFPISGSPLYDGFGGSNDSEIQHRTVNSNDNITSA